MDAQASFANQPLVPTDVDDVISLIRVLGHDHPDGPAVACARSAGAVASESGSPVLLTGQAGANDLPEDTIFLPTIST